MYVLTLDGILAAYYHSLYSVQLYGPTNFAPVIRHVARFAQVPAFFPSKSTACAFAATTVSSLSGSWKSLNNNFLLVFYYTHIALEVFFVILQHCIVSHLVTYGNSCNNKRLKEYP